MKKAILFSIVCFTFFGFDYPENGKDRILYIFPDDVELALNRYMERMKKSSNDELQFDLTLYREKDGAYRVFVNYYEWSKRSSIASVNFQWSELTHRYAVIKDKEYPLTFDYDYDFGTPKPSEIGEFGKREGMILRTIAINDGFSVTFNKLGIIR